METNCWTSSSGRLYPFNFLASLINGNFETPISKNHFVAGIF